VRRADDVAVRPDRAELVAVHDDTGACAHGRVSLTRGCLPSRRGARFVPGRGLRSGPPRRCPG
jgi:hypothetical protein